MTENEVLRILERQKPLFVADVQENERLILQEIRRSRILLVGGGGSIGRAVARELFSRSPRALHVVDISENSLVELVRDLRSSFGYSTEDFRTYSIDCGSLEFRALLQSQPPYDLLLNLSALKHVRSERDPFTLMRMLQVNVLNSYSMLRLAEETGCSKAFFVSTDKAANPANLMGASKRFMERILEEESGSLSHSSARFANVAFSDGSLLDGFTHRVANRQPLAAPTDVLRYFITGREAGRLCLLSLLLGRRGDIFVPKAAGYLQPRRFSDIASQYLRQLGYEALPCETEEQAREYSTAGFIEKKQWPCFFFETNTTGEKPLEEFFTQQSRVNHSRFRHVSVVRPRPSVASLTAQEAIDELVRIQSHPPWSKDQLVDLLRRVVPELAHQELARDLDQRM